MSKYLVKRFRNTVPQNRSGFTLIELLVVISIIILLATITLMTVRFSNESDRIKAAAQQVQSFLEGARDRAIYAKEPRGVRFFVSPTNHRAVMAMAYIAPGGSWSSPENSSEISLLRRDGDSNGLFTDAADKIVIVRGENNPGWWNLKRRGSLFDGMRIRIPKGPTGIWYPVDTSLIDITLPPQNEQRLLLTIPFADEGDFGAEVAHTKLSYEIELPSRLLPQDPSILPESVQIALDASKIPQSWRPGLLSEGKTGNAQFSGYMDIAFSPRGNVIGDAAGAGLVHLYVGDSEDSEFILDQFRSKLRSYGTPPTGPYPEEENFLSNVGIDSIHSFVPLDEVDSSGTSIVNWIGTDNPYVLKDRRYVSIVPQTGNVITQRVNGFKESVDSQDPFDIDDDGNFSEPDGLADDPYAFAESGKVAH